jgi:hypothetical protein
VRFIDPDGRDIWVINNQGYIVNFIPTQEYDQIRTVNNQGEIIGETSQFEYGTVNHTTIESENGESYDMFTISGDNNGESTFEMLAQNTDVEWSLGQFGEKGSGENRITTSHSDYSEGGMTSYLYKNPSQVMRLRNFYHNHPDCNPDPSFTSKDGSIGGDMATVYYYNKYYPNNQIQYAVYTLYAGVWGYHFYNKNTKRDAIRGKETELQEIIIIGINRKRL